MKKSVFLSFFLLIGITMFAQTKFGAQLKFGYSGLHQKYIGNDANYNNDVHLKPNLGGGFFLDKYINKHLYVTNELEYTRKGSKINNQEYDSTYWGRFTLNMPFIVYGLTLNYEAASYSIGVGGYTGYLIDGMNIKVWNYDNVNKQFDENEFHRFDYGVKLKGRIDLGGLYLIGGGDLGMRAVNDDHKPLGDRETKHRYKHQFYYIGLAKSFN